MASRVDSTPESTPASPSSEKWPGTVGSVQHHAPPSRQGGVLMPTGLQGQGPHSLSTKELRLQPWSMRPTCPHEGPGRHSTRKPELPLTRACIRVSCLSQELFLRSLAPLWEDGGDGGLLLPRCSGAQVPAPFTASSPALSSQSGFSSLN